MELLPLYLEYIKPLRGSDRFHRWSFITCIAALLERRVWIDRGRLGILFPNLYTILVGPPATGKSTAAGLAVNYLNDFKPAGKRSIHIGPTKITQAALYQELKDAERNAGRRKQSPMFIFASELAINMVDFGGGTLTNELIDFYDSKSLDAYVDKRTLSSGMLRLHNPSVVLLGCTTDSFLQTAARDKLITSGLASRIIFVVEPGRVPKERKRIELDTVAYRAILAGMEKVYSLSGPASFAKGTQGLFMDLADLSDDSCYGSKTELHQNYFGRKPDHILKVALCLAAARGSLTINDRDVMVADGWLSEIEPDMIKAFGVRSIENDEDLSIQILRAIPIEPQWTTKGDMLSKLFAYGKFIPISNVLEGSLKTLIAAQSIKVQYAGGDELYTRPRKNTDV